MKQRVQLSLNLAYLSLSVKRHASTDDEPSSVPVEIALSGSSRLLVRGEAGSGKSTLVNWLAVTAARGHFANELESWNGVLPLPIRLRRFTGQSLPAVDTLLGAEVGSLLGSPPEGWVRRQLLNENVLLLVDGVDEISAEHRPAVRSWLADLLTVYQRARVVVTSRPSSVDQDWLMAEGFKSVQINPMNMAEIAVFITRWHKAAEQSKQIECDNLEVIERRLVTQLEARPHLRALAGTPLLCAVLCALNVQRAVQLPQNRMELYRAALDMLLGLRDEERGVHGQITSSQRVILLRDLAWRLTLAGRVDLEKEQAVRYVARKLPAVLGQSVSALRAMTDLLERSGVLREPVEGRVDFIHRTFQEYLAAQEAVDDDQIDTLLGHALQPEWAETIVMAAGHVNRPQLRRLMSGILELAARKPGQGRYLYWLAASFLETAQELPLEMRNELDTLVRQELIPPSSSAEARSLARIGPSILSHLPQSMTGLSLAQIDATIRTAALCGNDDSIHLLARIASSADDHTGQSLVSVWEFYPAEEFARDVLSVLPSRKSTAVYGARHVPFLRGLSNLGRIGISIERNERVSDLSFLREMASPGSINISVPPCEMDLSPLRSLRGTHSVSIRGAREYRELEALVALSDLRALTLELASLSYWNDIRFVSGLTRISVLSLNQLNRINDFGLLGGLHRCVSLSLVGAVNLKSLRWLRGLSNLRSLNLTGCRLPSLLWKLKEVAPKLTHLVLDRTDVHDLRPVSKFKNLESLSLVECPVSDLSPLRWLPLKRIALSRGRKYRNVKYIPKDTEVAYV